MESSDKLFHKKKIEKYLRLAVQIDYGGFSILCFLTVSDIVILDSKLFTLLSRNSFCISVIFNIDTVSVYTFCLLWIFMVLNRADKYTIFFTIGEITEHNKICTSLVQSLERTLLTIL